MANEYNVETDIINVNERKLDDLKKDYNNFKKQMINLDNQNNLVSSVNRFNDKKMGLTQKQLSSLDHWITMRYLICAIFLIPLNFFFLIQLCIGTVFSRNSNFTRVQMMYPVSVTSLTRFLNKCCLA